MRALQLFAAGVAVCAMALPAAATTTVYVGEDGFYDFISALTSGAFNGFDFDDDGVDAGPSYTTGGVTFTAADGNFTGYIDGYDSPYLASNGTGAIHVSTAGSVLGLFLGSYFGDQTITYSDGANSGTLDVYEAPYKNFIGFISDDGPLSLDFSNDDELDVVYYITGGTGAVPEPASWALMVGGFGAIGGALRSRKKVSVTFA